MKFSCERCGKRYATAEAPAPGRVYRIKCRGCGHVIVLKVPAAPEVRPAVPETAIEFARAEAAPSNGAHVGAPQFADAAQESPPPATAAPPPEKPVTGSPADAGYVDLFGDAPDADRDKAPEASFLAAAQALLPEEGAASDPAASDPAAASPTAPGTRSSGATTLPQIPVIPTPPPQSSALPWILIGSGALVLLGILAFVFLNGPR